MPPLTAAECLTAGLEPALFHRTTVFIRDCPVVSHTHPLHRALLSHKTLMWHVYTSISRVFKRVQYKNTSYIILSGVTIFTNVYFV